MQGFPIRPVSLQSASASATLEKSRNYASSAQLISQRLLHPRKAGKKAEGRKEGRMAEATKDLLDEEGIVAQLKSNLEEFGKSHANGGRSEWEEKR